MMCLPGPKPNGMRYRLLELYNGRNRSRMCISVVDTIEKRAYGNASRISSKHHFLYVSEIPNVYIQSLVKEILTSRGPKY